MIGPGSEREQAIDTMIGLTRLSNLNRVIVAGSDSRELFTALRRRGFTRISTPSMFHFRKGMHRVGLIAAHASLADFDTKLAQIAPFLSAAATIAVLIDSPEGGLSLKIRNRLERLGFRIEAGVRCHQGLVLSAYREGFSQMVAAA
jgi:hypothetical protein